MGPSASGLSPRGPSPGRVQAVRRRGRPPGRVWRARAVHPAAAPRQSSCLGVMKAIVQDEYGSADVLRFEDVETPAAGRGEVLIRVIAASVFIGDWHIMTGTPYAIRLVSGLREPKQRVRGQDVAGEIEAVGEEVTAFRPGDEVFGIGNGTFAEYATAQTDKIAPKPDNLGFEEAATVPTTGCTALQGIRDVGKVHSGQRVLVIGAAGGVGSFAVQIAKAFGAHVTGVCSTSKVELVRVDRRGRGHRLHTARTSPMGLAVTTSSSTRRATARHQSSDGSWLRREHSSSPEAKAVGGGSHGSRCEGEGHVSVRRAEDDELPRAAEGGRTSPSSRNSSRQGRSSR